MSANFAPIYSKINALKSKNVHLRVRDFSWRRFCLYRL